MTVPEPVVGLGTTPNAAGTSAPVGSGTAAGSGAGTTKVGGTGTTKGKGKSVFDKPLKLKKN
jgi:hypothetical protein